MTILFDSNEIQIVCRIFSEPGARRLVLPSLTVSTTEESSRMVAALAQDYPLWMSLKRSCAFFTLSA